MSKPFPIILLVVLAVSLNSVALEPFEKQVVEAVKLVRSRDAAERLKGYQAFDALRQTDGLAPKQIAYSWIHQGEGLTAAREFSESHTCLQLAQDILEKLPKDDAEVQSMLKNLYERRAYSFSTQARVDISVDTMRQAAELWPTDLTLLRVYASYLARSGRETDAAAVLAKALEIAEAPALLQQVNARIEVARYHLNSKDLASVQAHLDAALAIRNANPSATELNPLLITIYRMRVELLFEQDQHEEAMGAIRELLTESYGDVAGLADLVIDQGTAADLEAALVILRDLQLANWENRTCFDLTQAKIVDLHLRLQQPKRAAWEARALYLNVSGSRLSAAANTMAAALKARDRSMVAANELLLFLRHGVNGNDGKPESGDEAHNPMPGMTPEVPTELAGRYDSLIAGYGTDWQARIEVARLQVMAGRLDEALNAYRAAFAASPGNQRDTQLAANELASFIGRMSRDEALVQEMMAFLMYGPNGEDGKAKTEDDLSSPEKRLAALIP